jgi:hypothetical protein
VVADADLPYRKAQLYLLGSDLLVIVGLVLMSLMELLTKNLIDRLVMKPAG